MILKTQASPLGWAATPILNGRFLTTPDDPAYRGRPPWNDPYRPRDRTADTAIRQGD